MLQIYYPLKGQFEFSH